METTSSWSALVLAGFARGAGPWVREHLLTGLALPIVDVLEEEGEPDAEAVRSALAGAAGAAGLAGVAARGSEGSDAAAGPALVVLAVPEQEMIRHARALAGVVPGGSSIVVVTAGSMERLAAVAELEPSWTVCGLHMLFDVYRSGPQGQTCFVVERDGVATTALADWLARRVEAAGGLVRRGNATQHDRTMALVQALPHRLLVAFLDTVLDSGLHLEDDLWEARTPLFEVLLSLAVSSLDTRRENSLIAAQQLPTAPAVIADLTAALDRFGQAEERAELSEHLGQVRGALTGAAYESLRRVGQTAVTAIQSKREALARYRATGELIGLRSVVGPARLRVGRVVALGPSEVTLEEVLVGQRGSAVLLEGPGVRNARRLGVAGRVVRTRFALGHVRVLEPDVLQRELDDWLGVIHRDVRLLVPESVSGAGVLAAVAQLPQVSDAQWLDEVVRVGQRSVVIRVAIRADRDLESTVETVRAFVAGVYRWPTGVMLAPRAAGGSAGAGAGAEAGAGASAGTGAECQKVPRGGSESTSRDGGAGGGGGVGIGYLGPAGSFSGLAAGSVAALTTAQLTPRAYPSFPEVVAGTASGDLGVLPISSSASGLVSLAVEALLASPMPVVAGGMVDVAVRFDAYGRPGTFLEELRGAVVIGHPQALAQCGAFIRRWGLQPQVASSNSQALAELARPGPPALALGVADRGAELGLVTLEREVDDLPGSLTRFLVIGAADSFGEAAGGARPTLRRVWVGDGLRAGVGVAGAGVAGAGGTGSLAGFAELLTDAEGRFLLVSSGVAPEQGFADRLLSLGEIPWSPRTPVVRPAPHSRGTS